MKQQLRAFLNDDSGQDLVEYALLLALVVLAAATGMGAFGTAVMGVWSSITSTASGYFSS